VEIHDVEIAIQNSPELRRLEPRSAALLGEEGRQEPERAAEPMNHDAIDGRRLTWGHGAPEPERILAMDDLHMMPLSYQRPGQGLHKYGVSAKVVRRIKRGNHAEAHETFPAVDETPSRTTPAAG
jgi:hypothetical protein